VAELRYYLIRLGIIKAAHVVLPRQELLRQILMSAAVFQPVTSSDSRADIAADGGADSTTASDVWQVYFLYP